MLILAKFILYHTMPRLNKLAVSDYHHIETLLDEGNAVCNNEDALNAFL